MYFFINDSVFKFLKIQSKVSCIETPYTPPATAAIVINRYFMMHKV